MCVGIVNGANDNVRVGLLGVRRPKGIGIELDVYAEVDSRTPDGNAQILKRAIGISPVIAEGDQSARSREERVEARVVEVASVGQITTRGNFVGLRERFPQQEVWPEACLW